MDGNERTAFAATYTFLAIDGWRLTAKPDEIHQLMLELYETQRFKLEALVAWLRLHTEAADVQWWGLVGPGYEPAAAFATA